MAKDDKEVKPKHAEGSVQVVRNFAFGNPNMQYRKGSIVVLSSDCRAFAVKNKLVIPA